MQGGREASREAGRQAGGMRQAGRRHEAGKQAGGPAKIASDLLHNLTPAESDALTASHLEGSILAAILLGSPDEYRHWLHNYVRHLTQCCTGGEHSLLRPEAKLREICMQLLGPPPSSSTSALLLASAPPVGSLSAAADAAVAGVPDHADDRQQNSDLGWRSDVLGLDKRVLLSELLPILGGNRSLQRFKNEFAMNLAAFQK